MQRITENLKCPLCGMVSTIDHLDSTYPLTVKVKTVRGGKVKPIEWTIKQSGYKALKRILIPKLEKLIGLLSLDNGCDFHPDCLTCERDRDSQCPDEVPALDQQKRAEKQAEAVRACRADGMTIAEVAESLKISESTVVRALRR